MPEAGGQPAPSKENPALVRIGVSRGDYLPPAEGSGAGVGVGVAVGVRVGALRGGSPASFFQLASALMASAA